MRSAGPSFDVPAWVATLAGYPREEIEFGGQTETRGYMSTTYLRSGEPLATVDLVGLPMTGGRRGIWQLFASVSGRVSRAQLPAATRFHWR